ncbi:MAG: hypothetical protein C4B59_07575 [Candidatus Methanogaster sp.]|uniref:Uncharacterized protein n=1 Tax=Candidatus Methanogaster sp. TaxID=3386292 RepID=A0AC61L3B3_9EURY|nr:MAG: hypothetical protein C4B59_07575 [ANME-2 cluster archaeon]
MNKEPLFFRDAGEMGDVLSAARRLLEDARVLEETTRVHRESVDEYREHASEGMAGQAIRELIDARIEDFRGVVSGIANEWREKKSQLETKEEGILLQQQAILEKEQEIESRILESEVEQREQMGEELQKISLLSANVLEQLREVERIKSTIDNILAEDEETIRDRLLSKEDALFLRLNYFSLMQSRLTSRGVTNPLTGDEYGRSAWEIGATDEGITAEITRGMIKKRATIRFEIKFLVPEDEEGFIYRKVGKDVSDMITGFIQPDEGGKNSYGALVLVSPTGWSEWIIDKVTSIRNMNKSVYLVDLSEGEVFGNDGDKKTKLFSGWFVPVSIEEEIGDMVAKLKEGVTGGMSQFRADKVALQYQVPRKIVMAAFREMVEDGKGEFILPEEGAKDVMLVVR